MFKTVDINIDELGIDLIKNYAIDKHIDYREIKTYDIRQGFMIKRWIISLIIGIILTSICFYLIIEVIANWDSDYDLQKLGVNTYSYIFITPFLLFAGGILMISTSLKKTKKLIINTFDNTIEISIKDIEKENKLDELDNFLGDRIDNKKYEVQQ